MHRINKTTVFSVRQHYAWGNCATQEVKTIGDMLRIARYWRKLDPKCHFKMWTFYHANDNRFFETYEQANEFYNGNQF